MSEGAIPNLFSADAYNSQSLLQSIRSLGKRRRRDRKRKGEGDGETGGAGCLKAGKSKLAGQLYSLLIIILASVL